MKYRCRMATILVLFSLSCSPPSKVPESIESFENVSLGGVTVPAQLLTEPFTLRLPRAGKTILEFGNASGEQMSVGVKGRTSNRWNLPPGQWTRVIGEFKEETALTWGFGELHLGSVYQVPKRHALPNILLLSIDTLRADRFNAQTMPQLTALFAEGRIYQNAYSPAPWTLPAHASMLTGQYPAHHGVRKSDAKLSPDVVTLAEVLNGEGFYTWAVTEGNFVSARYGLSQGFYRYLEQAPKMMEREVGEISKLAANLEIAREGVRSLKDVPQFLFFHTYEVHCPYVPRDGLLDPEGLGGTQWLLDNDGKPLSHEVYRQIEKLYDGEVAYTDALLAPFLRELVESGNWLIILTSDHGDEFGEHGGLLHGDSLYNEAVQVPLAIVGAGVDPGRVETACSLVDIAPSILQVLGVAVPDSWQGHTLMGSIIERPVFSESFFWGVHIPVEDARILSVISQQKKLIQSQNFGQIQAELYFLDQDPLEKRNRQAEELGIRDALFPYLEAYLANKSLTPEQVEALTPEQLEALRALGYVE